MRFFFPLRFHVHEKVQDEDGSFFGFFFRSRHGWEKSFFGWMTSLFS